ncbi:S24 family peptidase [Thioalkalivibrio sulfidiphilus]|uniref:S24 family peptidase n=1 Tax=Thioalkalivibrio sulfidiphilus TaxID=1033854 RepID=UPI0003773C36|nr:S24 family peptidase [Thioalkalivibrio sulfidiphilus]
MSDAYGIFDPKRIRVETPDVDPGMGSGCATSEPFALRVLGDSMSPEFEHGVIIIVDPAGHVESGSYVVAQHEEEYLFRQLLIEEGRYYLVALKDDHRKLEISGVDAIAGVVSQRAGTRRSQRKHYV